MKYLIAFFITFNCFAGVWDQTASRADRDKFAYAMGECGYTEVNQEKERLRIIEENDVTRKGCIESNLAKADQFYADQSSARSSKLASKVQAKTYFEGVDCNSLANDFQINVCKALK